MKKRFSEEQIIGFLREADASIAGLLSPLVSHSGLALALTSAALTVVAYGLWRWYLRTGAL